MDRRTFSKLLSLMMISSNQTLGAINKREKIIVIGAGIIGTTIAYELSKMGADVTLIDQEFPGSAASGSSFSWINATYPKKPYPYNLLSQLGIDAYRSLEKEINLKINWGGSLEWFDSDQEQTDLMNEIKNLKKYPRYSAVDVINESEARALEPSVDFNNQNIVFSRADGAIDTIHAINLMIENIKFNGGSVLYPCRFQGLKYTNRTLSSVETTVGELEADQAIFATGIDSGRLLSIDMMKPSTPGIIVTSKPTGNLLKRIIVGPGVHIHQQIDGRIIFGEQSGAPTSHLDRLSNKPKDFPSELFAQDHINRIFDTAKTFMKKVEDLKVEKTSIGWRPLPKDGRPVIGRIDGLSGIYIAVMHSGVSLAAIVGKLVSEEILNGSSNLLLKDFRPSRFN